MTLFSLAGRNIKRNFYDYFLYFLSMVFSIILYFTFVSIKYNEQVLRLGEVRERVAAGFTASSVILAIFALIFIWFSNSFFTRKRKKEIGLYSLLGVKKRQIARMLFYENILMGFIALLVGIFLGSLLSKVFVMILVRLMGFSAPITLTIIPEAIYSTLKIFTLLFFLTSIHGYIIIYRFKLVELFKAEQSAERVPRASLIKAILSIFLIFGGYYFYLNSKVDFLFLLLITLISVVIGTFLLFSSLSVYIIKFARKNKKRYYNGINMIGISNLLYRITGHARTLALIAVLSATTLTAMSVAAILYYDFKTDVDLVAPFSYVYMDSNLQAYETMERTVEEIIDEYPEHQIRGSIEYDVLKVQAEIPMGLNGAYSTNDIYLMSESSYNEIVSVRGMEKLSLDKDNQIILVDEYYNEFFKESYAGKKIILDSKIDKNEYLVTGFKKEPIVNLGVLRTTVIVTDEEYERFFDTEILVKGRALDISNEKASQELSNELSSLFAKRGIRFKSYYMYYQNGIINSGQAIFIGAFLGLVFLISTGSIIFFKLLSEANEEVMRYKILRNIGVRKKEIKALLAKQILFIFASPLLLGIMHSLVAVSILEKLLNMDLTVPILVTITSYTLIYMVYYFFTLNSYIKNLNIK